MVEGLLTQKFQDVRRRQRFFRGDSLGRRQAVSYRILIPAFAGSNPAAPTVRYFCPQVIPQSGNLWVGNDGDENYVLF